MKTLLILAAALLLEWVLGREAWAWGPGVHTVTALGLLNDLTAISPAVGRILSSFPREYLYGCLAADFFLGKGNLKQQRHPHNWDGGFRFLKAAGEEREQAFAYGFLSHLAADVVAHNFCIPNLMGAHAGGGRMGHIYWEIQTDHLIGSVYVKMARNVLSGTHRECDELLKVFAGRKKQKGLKAKKHIFAQSVKFSHYYGSTRDIFFTEKPVRLQDVSEYLSFMVGLSANVVRDFLTHPEASPCLLYDPVGRRTLAAAKRKGLFKRLIPDRWMDHQSVNHRVR